LPDFAESISLNSPGRIELDAQRRKRTRIFWRNLLPGLSELARGQLEASQTRLAPVDISPYLDPPPDTPYALRYAFHLLGDIRCKTVLELGCGSGENTVPLLARGANVIALDISPDLAALARRRVELAGVHLTPTVLVASAYNVPLRDRSVDVVLCASVVHHLNVHRAMKEMRRLLKPGGVVVVKEPVRFSRTMSALRRLFPVRYDISEDEHPLTRDEFADLKSGWRVSGERAFRLPLIPLFLRFLKGNAVGRLFAMDAWLVRTIRPLKRFCTSRVLRLEKIESTGGSVELPSQNVLAGL
jgi:SAM-dependent methyltransferase